MDLAIQGHSNRGNEVISYLERLGGKNPYSCNGLGTLCAYHIADGNIQVITIEDLFKSNEYILYNLEGILAKFPYKVGDKVHLHVQNDDIDGRYAIEDAEITSMRWNPARCKIAYKMKDINREFYEEEIKCKVDDSNKPIKYTEEKKINQMSLENCDLDEVEIVLGDRFELKIKGGKYYAVCKKSQYPKTYEECCKIKGTNSKYSIPYACCETDYSGQLIHNLNNFRKLLICRDAYWKIAGEEMGLSKPWEPDWENTSPGNLKWCMSYSGNYIEFDQYKHKHHILAFPTEEMRAAFYENFKELIKSCKELL